MDAKKAARWMARERKWLKEYVARTEGRGIPALSRQQIVDYASGVLHVGYGSTALDLLSAFHGARGCMTVLEGDDHGFVEVDLTCQQGYWMVRLLTRGYDLDQQPDKHARVQMDVVATCWMHAEAVGATAIRSWLDTLVRKLDGGHDSVMGKDMSPLCTLVAHFVTGKAVAELERAGWAPIGVYAPVVSHTLTSSDYDELATYHQEGVDGDGFPPFHGYPYRVYPAELLAIARRTGVPLASNHPLLTSPLARPREVPEIGLTDELRALVASSAPEVSPDPET